ncbi:hypothetical protein C8J56DRAFT_1039504 [Mycena floridula]|nr:hypothetical protein C8J56DRAFT_1039504 [Mycena floridula]
MSLFDFSLVLLLAVLAFCFRRRLRFRPIIKSIGYTVLFCIVLLILWFALPSPVPDDGYPQRILLSGQRLTRVFDLQQFFPYHDNTQSVRDARRTGRQYMALEFELLEDNNVLSIWGGDDLLIPITGKARPLPRSRITLSNNTIGVSQPIRISSNTGDLDGVNPPYFAKADAALLFWWFHHDTATITLRVRVEKTKVEVWPDSVIWTLPLETPTLPPFPPLLTVDLAEPGELPVFKFAPSSSSPSAWFYQIRLGLIFTLAPIALFGLVLLWGTIDLVRNLSIIATLLFKIGAIVVGCIAIYCLAWVFIWWVRNGRRPIPFREIGEAVSAVMHRQAQEPVVDEAALVDLEPQVLVDLEEQRPST